MQWTGSVKGNAGRGSDGPHWAIPELATQDVFELDHEIVHRQADHIADLTQFEDIQPPFPRLIFADDRLRHPEGLCHINLAQTGIHPNLPKQGQQSLLVLAVRSDPRSASVHEYASIVGLEPYPFFGYT